MVMMFSLAGIPPTAGFFAKLAVLEVTVNAGLTWLAVLAVLTSLFGAFYYLRIVKLMYFDAPLDASPIEGDFSKRTLLICNGLAVVELGMLPSQLLKLCAQAIGHTLPL